MRRNNVKPKGLMSVILTVVMMLTFSIQADISFAATDSVRIWDYETKEHRININIVAGKTTDSIYGYKVDGITEKSHAWSVENADICKVNVNGSRISITGLREGIAKLKLSIKANDGKTYSDYAYVSVYTAISTASGKTAKATVASRSARSGTDKKNERAMLPKGTELSIYGKCGNYYRATVNYNFADGLASDRAYILASDVGIPITKITLNKTNINLKEGEEDQLKAIVHPNITTEREKISYTSSNKNTAVIYKDGAIHAKNAGKTIITAKSGNVSTMCAVIVSVADESKKATSKKIKGRISEKYRYCFLNNSAAFGKKYKLDKKLRKLLAKKLVATGYFKNVKVARNEIDDILKKEWSGSCYGMTITTALNKKKQINVRVYTKSKGKGYEINRVKTPKKNERTRNIINYYHAAQRGYNKDETYYSTSDKRKLKSILKAAKKGYVQSFGFRMKYKSTGKEVGGHRILTFNYSKKKSKKNWYAIEAYDCSKPKGNSYVYIHKNFSKIEVRGWSPKYEIYKVRTTTNFGKYAKIKIK